MFNNRNSNLSNNKVYTIVDTKNNNNISNNIQPNYSEMSKVNNNIFQNQNQNQFLDDLFD